MKLNRVSVPVMTAAALIALAACAAPAPTPAPPAETNPPAEQPTPIASGEPLDYPCEDLVGASVVAALSPDLKPDPGYTPGPGTNAAEIVAAGGTACSWINTGATEVLVVAAAQPGDTAAVLSHLKSTSSPTSAYGTGDLTGFFSEGDGGMGDAEVVAGPFWISAVSTFFTADTDATPVIEYVQQALPGGQ